MCTSNFFCKRFLLFVTFLLSNAILFGQSPNLLTYQAVIRNNSNAILSGQAVGIKISILQGSSSGTLVYAETHVPTTNANGLVSLQIGAGTVVTGSLSAINWAANSYYLKTETDPNGGTAYSITGTTQLVSVPYALHAKSAADNQWALSSGNISNSNSGNVSIGTNTTTTEKLNVNGNILLTNAANRTFAVQNETTNLDGKNFDIRAGNSGSGFGATNGGNLTLTAGSGYNSSVAGFGGGDLILRSGANAITASITNGGSISLQTGGAAGTYTSRLEILENGKIGIGKTTPTAYLDFGNILTNRKIALYTDADNDHQFNGFGINASILRYQVAQTGGNHVFYAGASTTTSNELMRIKGNGKVLIGTTTESEQLTVADGITVDADNTNSGTTANILRFGTNPSGEGVGSKRTTGTGQYGLDFYTGHVNRMRIENAGNVCIGTTTSSAGYLLTVGGKIICTELRVQNTPFPDYVFATDYKLMPLKEVAAYIAENKHLPNMPPAAKVDAEGMSVGEIELKLVEKVEELTLHLIRLEQELEMLKTNQN